MDGKASIFSQRKGTFMHRNKLVRYLGSFALLAVLLVSLAGGLAAPLLAQEEEEEKFELFSKYPIVEGRSGDDFAFEVVMRWSGSESRSFDLELIEDLPDWEGVILGGYPQKKIFAIGLEPTRTMGETISVQMTALPGVLPDPGDYTMTIIATSGDFSESVELTAKVTARYLFAFYTVTGRLNTEVQAGKENHFPLRVQNTGSTPVTQIDFLSNKPEGWRVEYDPDGVDQVDPGYAAEIDLIIIPPREVVPGDYMLNLKTVGKEVGTRDINLRVTVLTPTIWGWVGVIVVVLVIAGLMFMFRQLGRR